MTLAVLLGAFAAVVLAGILGLVIHWFAFYRLASGTLNRNTPVISDRAAPYLLERETFNVVRRDTALGFLGHVVRQVAVAVGEYRVPCEFRFMGWNRFPVS